MTTDVFTCRHCGQRTETPQLFKNLYMQRIFEYIWHHPGCTTKEIHAALFSIRSRSNCAGVLVSKIKSCLASTDYMIAITRGPGKRHRPCHRLTIVKRLKPESSLNVSP